MSTRIDPKTGVRETEWQRNRRIANFERDFIPASDRQLNYVVQLLPRPRRKRGIKEEHSFRTDAEARSYGKTRTDVDTIFRGKLPVYRNVNVEQPKKRVPAKPKGKK